MIVARGYITLTNIQGSANLLDWQSQWKEGSLPAGWSLNGVAAENSIVVNENPFAIKSVMWKCTPNSDGNAAGGFTTPAYTLDDIHTYRFSVFVRIGKAISLPKELLLGCYNVDNLAGGANVNPYFIVYGPNHTDWCLLVGHIHPSKADNNWKLSTSGVYDMGGKKIVCPANDFKLRNPNIPVQFRSWLYHCTSTEESAYFYNPRLDVCDGNEMSIEQLLQISTRDEIDAVKVEYKSEIQKLDNKIAFSVSEVKSYADNKAVSEASKAIDSVRVGGRNYISATKLYSYLPYNTAPTYADGIITTKIVGTNGMFTIAINGFTPIYTETYTVSGVMKKNGNVVTNADWKNKAANTYLTPLKFKVDDSTGRFEITSYYNTNEGSRKWILHTGLNVVANDIITIEFLKFESGNKATDWSPAPEDVEADAQAKADAARVAAEAVAVAKAELAKTTAQAYADGKVTAEEQRAIADAQAKLNEAKADAQAKANAAQTAATAAAAVDATNKVNTLKQETNAQLTILSDQIASKVSTATFNALGNRVTAAESTITQHSNQIASKVSQSTFDALGTRVTAAESSITQIPNKISLAISEVNIGVRNYLLKSNKLLNAASYLIGTYALSENLVVGKEYTLVLCYKVGETNSSVNVYQDKGYSMIGGFTSKVEKVESKTFKFTSTRNDNGINIYQAPSGTFGGSYVKWAIIVEGNKAPSEWIAAPEDISSDIALRPTTEEIKTSLTLDSTGISLLGRKIALTGVVTFSALASDAQSKVNTAQSTANTAVTKADAAQSTANSAVSKADTAQSGLNTLIGKLGDMSYLDMVSLAKLDTTIIEGGFIKTNLIDANTIITNSLLAQKIAATDITTSRLTVTTGAKIGGWRVEGNSLITSDENSAKLLVEVSGTKFLRVNDLNTMLYIRTDGDRKKGISISTFGNSKALSITANGNGYAIESAGSHQLYQRSGEVWNAPGVLWAGRINANGGVQSHWGDGCEVSQASATAVGFYDIYHNLGHTDYYVMITSTPYTTNGDKWMFGMVINKYSNYFTVQILDANDGPRRCAFEIAIIGRNTI